MKKKIVLLTVPALLLLTLGSTAFAGRANRTWLTRAEGVEGEYEGFAVLKLDRDGEVAFFGVRTRHMDADTYDVRIGETFVGDFAVANDGGAGGLKVSVRRGDTLGVDDPSGETVSILASDGTVVLTGDLAEAGDGPPAPPPPPVHARDDLEPPEGAPADGEILGKIQVKSNRGGELLIVGVHGAEAGTYDVLMADGTGTMVDIGDLVALDGRPGGAFVVNNRRGDPLPFGVDSVTSLAGRAVQVWTRDDEPVLILEGTVPEAEAHRPPRHGR